jgi:N-acetylglutamate synthase-like GNAT family acetyltransferase
VTAKIEVRRARLSDTEAIAAFANAAQARIPQQQELTRLSVIERFSQVGFMIAEYAGNLVGLLGWQIENLVVRVTDYLVTAPDADAQSVAQALVERMEAEAKALQAESILLFMPTHPSSGLVRFWEGLGYEAKSLDALSKACREAVQEWGLDAENVMVKRLREGPISRSG